MRQVDSLVKNKRGFQASVGQKEAGFGKLMLVKHGLWFLRLGFWLRNVFEHQHLADPFSAYATLPFAMSVDGRALSDAEVIRLRNDEQIRRGEAVIKTLQTSARDLADKVRAGLGQ